ncbi:MAG: hypothetical protein P0Y52_14160 [Candidatus Brevundimonas phytovorans]|nr:hypothetical protein [Brevundimonas sp.]WEK57668.1 MAG: hypothetical protein P0Y52_14160 [Brevundimonas sp.]
MQKRWLFLIAVFAVALTILYLMTARVFLEGTLGDNYLMLKPYPSLDIGMGGGEEGAWSRAHPDQAPPWWQSPDAIRLLDGGSWEEEPVLWPTFYILGYLLTPVLWLVLAVSGLRRLISSRRIKSRA